MNIGDKATIGVDHILKQAVEYGGEYSNDVEDLLLLYQYGQEVHSQNGLGLCGFSFRQKNGNTLMTIKVMESGVPLVAFVTAHTPTGCVARYWQMFVGDRLNWRKDQYPWI